MTLYVINYARGGNMWLTILSYLMIRTQTWILHQINPYKIQKNKIKYVRPWHVVLYWSLRPISFPEEEEWQGNWQYWWSYVSLSSSWSHFRSASSSLGSNGYSLQSIVSGTSGFNMIAWSHGWDRGSFFDSTGSRSLYVCDILWGLQFLEWTFQLLWIVQ